MVLPPILYYFFKYPLPYSRTLALQEKIHQIQLSQRRASVHQDILLLLQHRPVFTAGRRQTDEELRGDRTRLTHMGADFEMTERGGELTYHGPGQLIGYPLLDLGRTTPAITVREYVCRLQRTLQTYVRDAHNIMHTPTEHTGLFVDEGRAKLGSIGVQVRHRLTTHGFSLNITHEPLAWFDNIVACGLADVKAGTIAGRSAVAAGDDVRVENQVPGIVKTFGDIFEREMRNMRPEEEAEIGGAILEIEENARRMGDWTHVPLSSSPS